MNTVPEKPNAKLSALIVNTKADKLGPALFKNKKNKKRKELFRKY